MLKKRVLNISDFFLFPFLHNPPTHHVAKKGIWKNSDFLRTLLLGE
jgi:hypothetical protein